MESRPKSAHRYNVQEQQDVYKEEIARIWKAQWDALGSPIEPQLTQEDEDRARGRKPSANRAASTMGETPRSMVGTPAGRAGSVNSDDDNVSVASGPAGGQTKILRIKRLVSRRIAITRILLIRFRRSRASGSRRSYEIHRLLAPTFDSDR